MQTAIYFGWAFSCAWVTRIVVVALLARRLGGLAYPLAYLSWVGLLIVGILVGQMTGFEMYGYNPDDPWQPIGAAIFFYSPLGLPLLFGAPFVLARKRGLNTAVGRS